MRKPRLGTILLVLWGIFLTGSAYMYLTWLQPARLGETVSRELRSSLDVQCSIGEISLSFFPSPTLNLRNLSLIRGSMDHIELFVRHALAEISWGSLLRLKPIVTRLYLDSPTLDVSGQLLDQLMQSRKNTNVLPSASFKLPDFHPSIIGTRFSIHEGLCRLSSPDGRSALVLSGIESTTRLPGLFPGHLNLSIASIHCALDSNVDITATNTTLSIPRVKRKLSGLLSSTATFSTSLQMGSLDAVWGHEISAPYRYFPLKEPLRLTMDGNFDIAPEQGLYLGKGTTTATAVMTMNSHDVPMSARIPFTLSGLDIPIQIENADLRMEDDSLTVSGLLSGFKEGKPVLTGHAAIHHFSLTRWFGFGRAITKGLQNALDNITGSFDSFELTPHGVVVPKLTAKVLDMDFTGSGSCAEFLKPDIRINIHAKQAGLDALFPELHGNAPDMSRLPPPVLPSSPSKENLRENDVPACGYDIHIMADKAELLKFTPANVDVHIIPAPNSGTMLKISAADFYKGNVTSEVYLQKKIRVTAALKNVSTAEPVAVLAGFPALNATLKQGTLDITFLPGDMLSLLSSLGGSVQATFTPGSMRAKDARASFAFKTLSIQAEAAAAPPKNLSQTTTQMDFRGAWNVALETEHWKLDAKAPKATIAFSTKNGLPTSMKRQNIAFTLTLGKNLSPSWPQDIVLTGNTALSFPASFETFELTNAVLLQKHFRLEGNAFVKPQAKDDVISGQALGTTSSLEKVLQLFGAQTDSFPFHHLNLGGAYAVSKNGIEVSNISGKLDKTNFSGQLKHSWQGRPHTESVLRLSSLDLDEYLSSLTSNSGGSRAKIPLSLLKEQDVNLQLNIDKLRAFKTTLTHCSFPILLKDGRLSIPAKAQFPGGGEAALNFSAALAPGGNSVSNSASAKVSALNLLALCRDRRQKTLLDGTGSLHASLTSQQTYWDDWKHTLDGNVSFTASKGAVISTVERPGQKSGESRTEFQTLSASANVNKGIVTSKDFLLDGALSSVKGEGTINLQKQTIDAKATVTLAGIPEMPVSIKGDLAHPKTDYKLLGAVVGTVGNIGSTTIDILGFVLTSPFKFFTGNKTVVPPSEK